MHLGRWETAAVLTGRALETNPLAVPMFCNLWEAMLLETPMSEEKTQVAERVKAALRCDW